MKLLKKGTLPFFTLVPFSLTYHSHFSFSLTISLFYSCSCTLARLLPHSCSFFSPRSLFSLPYSHDLALLLSLLHSHFLLSLLHSHSLGLSLKERKGKFLTSCGYDINKRPIIIVFKKVRHFLFWTSKIG